MEPLAASDSPCIGTYQMLGVVARSRVADALLGRSRAGQLVVVTVMHDHPRPGPSTDMQFVRELEAARPVRGAHIVSLVDGYVYPSLGPLWLAVEYVPGPSLREVVTDGGPLPESQVTGLATGIVDALAAIRAAGLVHGHLTPDDVIVTESGPRVGNFGVTGVAASPPGFASGRMEHAFESPEYMGGHGIRFGSDVFALGGVLTFALTGHGPFAEGSLLAMQHRIGTQPPELSGVPEGQLRRVIEWCLVKDCMGRPSLEQIRDILCPPSPTQRALRRFGRHLARYR